MKKISSDFFMQLDGLTELAECSIMSPEAKIPLT